MLILGTKHSFHVPKAWLCYSANFASNWNNENIGSNPPGSRYGLVLQEIEFLDSAAKQALERKESAKPRP
jgi:hypothetical protein